METEIIAADEDIKPGLWLDIAYDIASDPRRQTGKLNTLDENGEVVELDIPREPTVDWLAKKYELTVAKSISIIMNPKFSKFVHEMQTAIARVSFDRKAYDILDEVMEEGDNREKIAAIKVAAELLGYRSARGIQVNVNIDSLIRQADNGEKIIDAEVYPGL